MTVTEQRAGGSRFWRQFDANGTFLQAVFDGAFGILVPLAFLAEERLVLQPFAETVVVDWIAEEYVLRRGAGEKLGTTLEPAFYAVLATQMAMLAVCLVLGRRTARWSGWLAGWFAVGSVVSLAIASATFIFAASAMPETVIQLLKLPATSFTSAREVLESLATLCAYVATSYATHFVYLRNTIRAFKRAKGMPRLVLWATVGAGLLIAASLPAVVQWQVPRMAERAAQQIIDGDRATAEAAVRRLKWVHWCCHKYDQKIYTQWWELTKGGKEESERTAVIVEAYQKLTGRHPGDDWMMGD